jgi:hypothetical protein
MSGPTFKPEFWATSLKSASSVTGTDNAQLCARSTAVYIRRQTVRSIMDCCDHCHPSDPERGNPAIAARFGPCFHRTGDANMRSAWICTRNDVIGNLAVLLAALGVFDTGTGWPDVLVAATMAALALQGASKAEWRTSPKFTRYSFSPQARKARLDRLSAANPFGGDCSHTP